MERTYKFTQEQLKPHLDQRSARKTFELDLEYGMRAIESCRICRLLSEQRLLTVSALHLARRSVQDAVLEERQVAACWRREGPHRAHGLGAR